MLREEIRYIFYLVGIGMGLTWYAHANFSTKRETGSIIETLKTIDQRVYEIHKTIYKDKK